MKLSGGIKSVFYTAARSVKFLDAEDDIERLRLVSLSKNAAVSRQLKNAIGVLGRFVVVVRLMAVTVTIFAASVEVLLEKMMNPVGLNVDREKQQ